MPSKKKSKKSKPAAKKAKKTARAKPAVKKKMPKKSTKKRIARKKVTSRRKITGRRGAQVSSEREVRQEYRDRNASTSGRESSDFQGLSRAEQADSESVDELVEEGNLFEAGAVAGVEEADDSDEKEVHTHEVPENDVPEEYLDED
jgi:hypothetical protein